MARVVLLVVLMSCGAPSALRAQDFDFDTVPDASDNCEFVPNLDQADNGGFDSALPDGDGDRCQCGDLSGEGRVDVVDAAVLTRHVGGRGPGPADAFTCSVTGSAWDCDTADALALRQALAGFGPGVQAVCRAAAGSPGLPSLDSAAGDSITKAFGADCPCNAGLCGLLVGLPCLLGGDQPQHSWFDGSSGSVLSVHDRYQALDPNVAADSSVAMSGTEMLDAPDNFAEQALAIVAGQPDLVTVMLGGNDLCNRDCVGASCPNPVYSDAAWRLAVQSGLDVLAAGLPLGASVYLVSVPRVQDLRAAGVAKQTGNSDIDCDGIWSTFDVCSVATQGSPLNGETLATRLAGIEERQRRYNEILREEAIAYSTGARPNPQSIEVIAEYVDEATSSVGTESFGADDINGGDCFHPSLLGQNRLSEVIWWSDPRRTGP